MVALSWMRVVQQIDGVVARSIRKSPGRRWCDAIRSVESSQKLIVRHVGSQ